MTAMFDDLVILRRSVVSELIMRDYLSKSPGEVGSKRGFRAYAGRKLQASRDECNKLMAMEEAADRVLITQGRIYRTPAIRETTHANKPAFAPLIQQG